MSPSDKRVSKVAEEGAGTIVGLPEPDPRAPTARPRRSGKLAGTTLLGRYDVEELIGSGGMASVYRGRHRTIGNPVAIKVLDTAIAVPDAIDRFLREVQATSRIEHENVVAITDFGSTKDGIVFAVMELLTGETLHRTIRAEGKLPPDRCTKIMLQLCAALGAAHALGIVHRDLKPENCFRTPRTSNPDFIKVLDFGIAKVLCAEEHGITAAPRQTRVGVVIGTPEFMAPEQARAEDCDHRADIYAAGVILFLMLAGSLPYEKPNAAETLAMHMYHPVPSLLGIDDTLPPALCRVAERAMAKDPDDRFQSMEAMAEAISAAMRGPVAELKPERRRARWWFVAFGALGVATSAAGLTTSEEVPPSGATAVSGAADLSPPPQRAAQPPRGLALPVVVGEPDPEPEPSPDATREDAMAVAQPVHDPVSPPPRRKRRGNKRRAGHRSSPAQDPGPPAFEGAPPTKPAGAAADDGALGDRKISEVKNPFD